jgi:hypothetical protein
MSKEQIQWAERHDWFHHVEGGVVFVLDRWVNADGSLGEDVACFDDYKSLRQWAGY